MLQGTVKWFNEEKGFGFIQQKAGDDLFVHISQIKEGPLEAGDQVEFEVGENRKGVCAVEVRVLK